MDDLKLIKRHYGEKMMHLCRELFPTLLETEGLLYKTLTSRFAPSRFIYEDIKENDLESQFKDIIYKTIEHADHPERAPKSAKELLKEAGYTLYECKSEKDIQSFRHYYKRKDGKVLEEYKEGATPPRMDGEELCTFNGGRLDRDFVFFAVKDNVDTIERAAKGEEERQDEYGTSVISIQFTRGKTNTLSIKNRYNHTAKNPDATFSNDLDNIILGLTAAFERDYNLNINSNEGSNEFPGYVLANDGKYYKYNYEIDNVYFCPDNIVIDNFEVIKYDESRYIVMDYFILDMKEKTITCNPVVYNDAAYDPDIEKECFHEDLESIRSIKVHRDKSTGEKTIIINNDIVIALDKTSQIIKYKNHHLTTIGHNFLSRNINLESIDIPNVEEIKDNFLFENCSINEINLPKVRRIGRSFIHCCNKLSKVNLPEVEEIGDYFLNYNSNLSEINIPNVRKIGNNFLTHNYALTTLSLPKAEVIGNECLEANEQLREFNAPNIEHIGNNFLLKNEVLKSISLPKVKRIGHLFLRVNTVLENIDLPELEEIGTGAFSFSTVESISLPKLRRVGTFFMENNTRIEHINLPNLEDAGRCFIPNTSRPEVIVLPKLKAIGSNFLDTCFQLEKLILPSLDINPQIFMHDSHVWSDYIELKDYIIENGNIIKKEEKIKGGEENEESKSSVSI